jgi:hypothetical protein
MKKFISMAILMVWTISVTSAFADQTADSPADLQELSNLQKVYQQNQAQKKLLQRSVAQASAEGHQCSADQSAASYTKPDDRYNLLGDSLAPSGSGTAKAGSMYTPPSSWNLFPSSQGQ